AIRARVSFNPIFGGKARGKRIRRPVSRVLSLLRRGFAGGDHSSRPRIAARLARPTRTARAGDGPTLAQAEARRPYLVLLQAGLTMPSLSPGTRCALTAPFHPYPPTPRRRRAVCFLWRYPWARARRALPAALSPWSPDFPRSRFAEAWRRRDRPAV